MSSAIQPLEEGKIYHIYNHAVGSRNLFIKKENYERFLYLYDKYINPIVETYAWVLMPNHFHLLVRIKEDVVYKYCEEDFRLPQLQPDRSIDAVRFSKVKWQTIKLPSNLSAPTGSDRLGKINKTNNIKSNNEVKVPVPHLHFSHLFNAYSRYYNKINKSRGTLFERPFKRKLIDNETYLKRVTLYIHNNPIHHNFCSHQLEYPWSSYLSIISGEDSKTLNNEVLEWFDNKKNFEFMHNLKIDIDEIENWLEI